MTTPTSSLTPDTLVHGRYRVVRQIGRGGMGAVYEAVDTRLGSTVALKQTLVRGAQLDDAFAREARLLSSLRHHALPVVSDYFAEGDGHFLVMQFIPGTDLAALMGQRSAPFGFGELLPWADQLLDALDYLHTQSPPIIHRDIKPQNLKLTPRGEIVLLDFGLAKGGTTGLDATQAPGASLFGYTPQYAPLEQIQATGTDPRSDLYSLAATLYALLAHTPPPNALDRASALLQGVPDPLRPLVEINPQVPRAVSDLLARCMALTPADRPQSAAVVRAELTAALRTGSAGASTAGMSTIAQPRLGGAGQPAPGSSPTPPATFRSPPLPISPGPIVPAPRPGAPAWMTLLVIGAAVLMLVGALGSALLFFASSFSQLGFQQVATALPTLDPREQDPVVATPDSREQDPVVAVPTVVAPDIPDIGPTIAAAQATANAALAEAQATAQAAFGGGVQAGSSPGSLGSVTLEFGEEGTGDGFLQDPRAVAVGPDGAIYVADYSTRRVQRFSPEGRFEQSFFVDDDRPILALAADRSGRIYVAQNFQVSVFDGATGELVDTFGEGYEDLIVLGDGSLIGIPWAGDDLVRLTAEGRETGRIPDLLSAADTIGSLDGVAADGLGTLYVVSSTTGEVFVFSPEGAFRDKFAAPGADFFPAIAVDGQGRVYVTSFLQGVQVFEPDGQAVGTITVPGVAFDLSVGADGNLYAATNAPRVVKMALTR